MAACRQGLVSGVQLDPPQGLELHQLWLVHYGITIPETLGYCIRVRFDEDPDAPDFPYPASCVWAPPGLSPTSGPTSMQTATRIAAGGQTAAAGGQTAAAGEGQPPARKRTKVDDLEASAVEAKVVEKQAAGKLADLSIPELKCWLKARKLPLGGKKADLVQRVTGHLAPAAAAPA
ncbi:hypothetical protein WJX72_003309 [[Myrmecia] bisecta]|uniref:SAP domain-containing protein n=1 Tax=[Myrmecia] bisecta TaxID=41462 RepID=A0AAW1PJP9_9CHLO